MAPASPSPLFSAADSSRLKWKKRKRVSNHNSSGASKKQQGKPSSNEDDDNEEEEEEEEEEDEDAANVATRPEDDVHEHRRQRNHPTHADSAIVNFRENDEVLCDEGGRTVVSDFPLVLLRSVNRPHRSVLGIVAAELSAEGKGGGGAAQAMTTAARPPCIIENISHGQLQVLSAVLPDHPALSSSADSEKPPAYLCSPPQLIEGKGVVKRFGNGDRSLLVVPVHSDWFHPKTVHRLERQLVPHFFSGRSKNHTPEKYCALRNSVVDKYLENPRKRLSIGDCESLPLSGGDASDLNRIFRFLDHWGIINYLACSGNREPPVNGSLIREEANGELQLAIGPLRSIDSLIQFDRLRSTYRPEDVLPSCTTAAQGSGSESLNLDGRISERLSEHSCSYCSCPLPMTYYQSQKETDTVLCSPCFHDGKFIIGHSSLDFMRADLRKDSCDIDSGESWTDQETFLLLEALEKYHDNWNEIADHVGTKSKAQCILHFVRLPMQEDGFMENLALPPLTLSVGPNGNIKQKPDGNPNGPHQDENSDNRLPFSSTANPIMALVAFLSTSIGPRIAATCANATLTILTKDDGKIDLENSDGASIKTDPTADHASSGYTKGNTMESQGFNGKSDSTAGCLPTEREKLAAMTGLSAAATKAKLFADQEEREIQRLTAAIVNYQLKRLELKLKQFAEIETLLLKECEQVERSRQNILAERARMLSARLGQAGPVSSAGAAPIATGSSQTAVSLPSVATAAAQIINANTRQAGMPPLGGQQNLPPMAGTQTNLSTVFGNNIPALSHMPFMPRQPMFPYVGPRLPLSAIHPPPSQVSNVMLPSSMSGAPTTNNHPLLRNLSGNSSSMSQG